MLTKVWFDSHISDSSFTILKLWVRYFHPLNPIFLSTFHLSMQIKVEVNCSQDVPRM